jgi:L-lactate dehydrogenase (cytochrome)
VTPETLLELFPAVEDFKKIAKRRMPHLAWEYLDSGTGRELAVSRNRSALDQINFCPKVLKGSEKPDLSSVIFGQKFDLPFGIAPIGMTGLMWPGAEHMLARSAVSKNIPYCLSTVACETPETVGEIAGANAWFQLYTFDDWRINADLMKRAADAGFSALLITVDVPIPSMRERQRRAGLRVPPATTPRFLLDLCYRPAWVMATLNRGKPGFRMLEKYVDSSEMAQLTQFIAKQRMGGSYQWEDIRRFREMWHGPIILKGIMHSKDAELAVQHGLDGIVVSNHGGRQFDGAPASISVLSDLVMTVNGRLSVLFDSGVRTGLDVLRALALGADFVFAGRPFIYGAAAMGQAGTDHIVDIFKSDIENNMIQLGVKSLSELRELTPV